MYIYIYIHTYNPQPVETAKFHSSFSFAGPRSLAAGLEGGDPGTPTLRHGRRIELNIMSVLYIGTGDHIYIYIIYKPIHGELGVFQIVTGSLIDQSKTIQTCQ